MQLVSVQDPLKIVQHAIWELPSRVKWLQAGFCLPAAPSHTEAAIPMCLQLNIAAAPQNDRRAPSPGSRSLLRALLIWMSTKQPSKRLGRTGAGDWVQRTVPPHAPRGTTPWETEQTWPRRSCASTFWCLGCGSAVSEATRLLTKAHKVCDTKWRQRPVDTSIKCSHLSPISHSHKLGHWNIWFRARRDKMLAVCAVNTL